MPQQILGTTVQKTDDAVGIFRNDQEKKHWYVAVVNNRSEKACQDRLRKRLKNETDSEKAWIESKLTNIPLREILSRTDWYISAKQ